MKYKLIVLEGLDCCGKTTVSKILAERLSPSVRISFPDRTTEIGKVIDKFLKKEIELTPLTAHLLYSSNRYEKMEFIKQALEEAHVISDRYYLSGAVYSAAKGLDFDWCLSVDKELLRPDYTFFIDVDPTVTSKRKTFGGEAHDRIGFQEEVYRIYKERQEQENVIVIDGRLSANEIADEIMKCLSK